MKKLLYFALTTLILATIFATTIGASYVSGDDYIQFKFDNPAMINELEGATAVIEDGALKMTATAGASAAARMNWIWREAAWTGEYKVFDYKEYPYGVVNYKATVTEAITIWGQTYADEALTQAVIGFGSSGVNCWLTNDGNWNYILADFSDNLAKVDGSDHSYNGLMRLDFYNPAIKEGDVAYIKSITYFKTKEAAEAFIANPNMFDKPAVEPNPEEPGVENPDEPEDESPATNDTLLTVGVLSVVMIGVVSATKKRLSK